jgi:DNA-directed RNA polymerase specialized sigma24 family protein
MNTPTTADALQALDPYSPSLLRQARGLCRNDDQAEDLVQDTLFHAAERLHMFQGGSLRAWLGTSLQRRFLDDCRRPRPIALDELDGDVLPTRDSGPEAEALGRILTQDALTHCRHPHLFLAVALEGESITDLAHQTGENIATLTARVRRDRERLRAYFAAP